MMLLPSIFFSDDEIETLSGRVTSPKVTPELEVTAQWFLTPGLAFELLARALPHDRSQSQWLVLPSYIV
jgi:hypothetical protein